MVMFKKRDSVPSASYSSVCNVLRQWRIWLIPTYRVYRLYDTLSPLLPLPQPPLPLPKTQSFQDPPNFSLPYSLYLSLTEKPNRFDEDPHPPIDDLPGHPPPRPPSSIHVNSRCMMVVLGKPCLSSIREVPVAGETGLLVLATCSYNNIYYILLILIVIITVCTYSF